MLLLITLASSPVTERGIGGALALRVGPLLKKATHGCASNCSADHLVPQQINRLSISPDKRFLAAAGNGTVKLYDIAASAAGSGGANVGPVRAFVLRSYDL